jgi:hypothetical protein
MLDFVRKINFLIGICVDKVFLPTKDSYRTETMFCIAS